MEDTLKSKTIRGFIWSGIERFAGGGLNFLFGLALARLLLPSQYGIIAMLAIFMAISTSIIDSGFANALIRKLDRTEKDNSTAFYINIVAGLVMYAILYLCAPLIADFYDTPELTLIARVFGVTLILNSLCIVQQALLTVKIDFKTQAKVSIFSALLSGVIGITVACYGYGVWALVDQGVSAAALRALLLWIMAKWRPRERFSKKSFKSLFGYGSKLLAAGILATIYQNLYTITIGKVFNARVLGLYSRGEQLAYYPASNIVGVIQRVSFPVLSSIQNEEERFKSNFLNILQACCFIIFPLSIMLIVIAQPFVTIVLTDKWIGCVPVIQILSLTFMWYPVHILNLNVLQVKGRSDLYLRVEVIKKIVGVAVLAATIPFGIIVICWGRVIYCIFELFMNTFYTVRVSRINLGQQMRKILPILAHSFAMGIVAFGISYFISSDAARLVAGVAICLVYWVLLFLLSKNFLHNFNLKTLFNAR